MTLVFGKIHRGKNNCTLGFELAGRYIAPLNLNTEKVAGTGLSAAWFWPP